MNECILVVDDEAKIIRLAKDLYLGRKIEAERAGMAELELEFKFYDVGLRHRTVSKKKAETGPSSMMKTVEREDARKTQQAEFHGSDR